jgi:hypothetical protein
MRALFTDYANSASHVLIGVIGAYLPLVTFGFVLYQFWEFSQDMDPQHLVVDTAEFIIGYFIVKLLNL